MADVVSYYVGTSPTHGPASVHRRRPDAEHGARVDETFAPREDSWFSSDAVRKYEAGRADWDYYGVHPDEGEQMVAWLRRVVEAGRDDAGTPPVPGEWGVGYAWLVQLKGPLSEETVTTVLDRLGMTRRAYVADWRERDLGLRVLRSDMAARWNFELYRASDERWFLRLVYLRRTPDERVIQELREQVYAVVAELGLEIVDEQVGSQESYPYSERARGERRTDADLVLAMWFLGRMTEEMLRTLHKRLGIEAEWGADLDDETVLEWGAGYLPNDGRFRAQLRLRRAFADENEWRFEVGIEGQRPPEATIDRWRAEIMAAATEVGLAYERDWLAPRPMPKDQTQPIEPPARTSAAVQVLYRAYLAGGFTAETLDEFREALGIGKHGRIDDDAEQFYGERTLRDGENQLVRLMLGRTFDGDWYLSLSYQGDPPVRPIVDQLARNIHAAAAGVGVTVSQEWHNPPGGDNS